MGKETDEMKTEEITFGKLLELAAKTTGEDPDPGDGEKMRWMLRKKPDL